MSQAVDRNKDGTYPKGVSGNPAGRGLGKKNVLTQLRQDMEIALREHVKPSDLKEVIGNLVVRAKTDNKAAKFLLEFFIAKAKDTEDVSDAGTTYIFRIEHASFASPVGERTENAAIPAVFEEVKQ